MATGYAIDGHCFTDATTAAAYWASNVVASSGWATYGVKSVSISGNTLSYVIQMTYTDSYSYPGYSGSWGPYAETLSGSLVVPSCDPVTFNQAAGVGGSSVSYSGPSAADVQALTLAVKDFSTTVQKAADTGSFDVNTALAVFAFFFGTILSFFGISATAGSILQVIKRPLGRG